MQFHTPIEISCLIRNYIPCAFLQKKINLFYLKYACNIHTPIEFQVCLIIVQKKITVFYFEHTCDIHTSIEISSVLKQDFSSVNFPTDGTTCCGLNQMDFNNKKTYS
jgi:hypothetical protein